MSTGPPRVSQSARGRPARRAAAEGGSLAVGPLCRLRVTMHEFSRGGFLSYVQIDRHGVVLVDGGSYLVAVICAAGVDLPAVKLRAVQVRHVFGLLHQRQLVTRRIGRVAAD